MLPAGIAIAGYLPREDARDAFISGVAGSLADLPARAVVGSASLRRQAMVKRARPDLEVTLLRGNVGTRLGKVERGEIAATLLAIAGLNRLGLAHHATALLDPDVFIPAVGQGAIAITTRTDDAGTQEALAPILDSATGTALATERAFLTVLDGSCRTPIGGHATVTDGRIAFRGILLSPTGHLSLEAQAAGPDADAERLGREAGLDIRARMPPGILDG
jgi:hydroxymethylbilane synthase